MFAKKKLTVNLKQEKVNAYLKANLLSKKKKKKKKQKQPQNKRKNELLDYLNKDAKRNKQ